MSFPIYVQIFIYCYAGLRTLLFKYNNLISFCFELQSIFNIGKKHC